MFYLSYVLQSYKLRFFIDKDFPFSIVNYLMDNSCKNVDKSQ